MAAVSNAAEATIGHNRAPETSPLLDRLKEDHAEAMATIERVAGVANNAPAEVTDDAIAAVVTDVANDAAKLWKVVEAERVREKAPFKEGVYTVDGFFRDPLARLDRIDKALMARVNAWNTVKRNRQLAAEREAREAAQREADEARKRAEEAAAQGRTEDALADLEEVQHAEAKADQIAPAPKLADATRITTNSGVVASGQTEWTFTIEDPAKLDLNALRDFLKPDAIEAALRAFVKINKGTKPIAGVRFFEQVVTRRRRG